MKISIIMRYHDDTASGGRKVIYDYANYLVDKGHKVEIVFLADVPYKIRKHNIIKHVGHYIDYKKRFKEQYNITWFKLLPQVRIRAEYTFKQNSCDDTDVLIAFDYGIALHIAESGYDLQKIVYVIQHDEKVYNDEAIVRAAWRLPIQKVVIATWLYNLVSKYDNQVKLVRNYVRNEDFYITKPVPDRKHVVSLINHTNKYKDTATGLKAVEIVHKRFPDLQVILFGNFLKPNNLPNYVQYIKRASTYTLREKVYNQSSVFLLPSILEGWGLVATEAMASGAALVSTKNGGVDDFGIEKETALLNEVGDYEGLANSIIYLFKNDDVRITLAEKGAKLVRKLTFESSAENFENVLIDVAKRENN